MAARFLAPVLSFLDKTFRFIGGDTGLAEIENALPIQRVLDISRTAQMAAAAQLGINGGYLKVVKILTHAGADTQRSTFTISASFFTSFAPLSWPHDLDAWLIDCWTGSATSVMGAASAIGLQRIQAPSIAPGMQLLFHQTAVGTVSDAAAAGNQEIGISTVQRPTLPVRLFDGDILTFLATSDAAGDTSAVCMLWVGPKGVLPPGEA